MTDRVPFIRGPGSPTVSELIAAACEAIARNRDKDLKPVEHPEIDKMQCRDEETK